MTANTTRRLKWTAKTQFQSNAGAGTTGQLTLTDSTPTTLQVCSIYLPGGANDQALLLGYVEAPSAGSITRKLRFARTDAATWQMSAAATSPAYLLCEDIGPAS